MTTRDHVFKGFCDFMTLWIEASHSKSPPWSYVFRFSSYLARLSHCMVMWLRVEAVPRHCGNGDMMVFKKL